MRAQGASPHLDVITQSRRTGFLHVYEFRLPGHTEELGTI